MSNKTTPKKTTTAKWVEPLEKDPIWIEKADKEQHPTTDVQHPPAQPPAPSLGLAPPLAPGR